MTRAAALVLSFALLGACRGHVTLDFVKPANVTINPQVQVLAPIDRAGAHLSGEALAEVVHQLQDTDRFQLVEPAAAAVAFAQQPGLAGMPVHPDTAKGVCALTGAQGLLVLETMQPDPSWSDSSKHVEHIRTEGYTEDGEDKVREIREEYDLSVATLTLEYTAFWSTYDCNAKVLDAFEFLVVHKAVGEGDTPAQARAAISDQNALHYTAARDIARRYARRISPSGATVQRSYYRSGSGAIRSGAKAVASGDWERAQKHLTLAVEEAEGKTKGKALYDLALAAEAQGDLPAALGYAERADTLLANNATARYVRQLQKRAQQEKKLGHQMGE